ncbi:hypothetical protein EPI10_030594 [Gossypium australe]|uniref:G-patch domain-containing protein n=1 Tax=Gossypium australe TaxID=47621 RepID=A0A5B6X142_9ROSI|nr:hypothetical protein EPI10_030594 [Gossypium australe]
MKQYSHVTDMTPNRITVQNMEKKANEGFRQYTKRWMEIAIQVQPPLLEKKTTMLFINTLKAPFITHMLGSTTKSFSDIVMTGEMIENTIKSGKIEVKESNKRMATMKKENEVNNTSMGYSKSINISQPKIVTTGHQGSSRKESGTRQNTEKLQFTPIPMTYKELYQRITGHSIENCLAFKKLVEKFISMGIVELDDTPNADNPLPNHTNNGVNAISESSERRIKASIAEVKTPLRLVWKEMVKRRLVVTEESWKVDKLLNLVQNLMNNKEMEFCEEGAEERSICASESTTKSSKVSFLVVIISRPKSNKAGVQTTPKIIIQKPAFFSYKDNKRVPWNYDCNVTIQGKASASKEDQGIGSHTRNGKHYDLENTRPEPVKGKAPMVEQEKEKSGELESLVNEPVREEEAKEFLKFFKHNEYSVVEQLHKQPARISVLALLLSSDVHRNALMKVLNETYVANDISVNNLDQLIGNISADNFIYFNDDEILPGGKGSTKALHITTLLGVLIDNRSALNVLPLSTLNRLPVDSSHMKECMNIVKAFDGTQRRVMGRIDIPLLIAGAVSSSLHQKLKLVTDGRLITIKAEEDIIAAVTSNMPYLEINDETTEFLFRSLKFMNATFIMEGNRMPAPKISKTTMGLLMTVGKGALPGKGLGKYLQGRVVAPMLKEKQDRFGLGFRPDAKQRKKELERMQERRMARLSGEEVKWEPMIIPHISKTFASGGVIHAKQKAPKGEDIIAMLGNVYINAISEEAIEEGTLSDIRPYEPRSVLDNWTAEEIPIVFRAYS